MMMMAMMARRKDKAKRKRKYVARRTDSHESAVSTGYVVHKYLKVVFIHRKTMMHFLF